MKRTKVLAVSSGGGHWVQLIRIRKAFSDADTTYVTVRSSYRNDVPGEEFRVVRDATRWSKVGLLILAIQMLWIVICRRPDVVVTTGAAPGYFAIRIGRLFGAKTCWIDSIANVEAVSMSGKMVASYTHLWLTQWQELATQDGPRFHGSVISANSTTNKDEPHGHSPTAGSC